MKTQIIEVITNKQQFFVVENESVIRLTEKKLEKYIPNFSDMTLEAREKHFKKWLKNDAYCICCVECGPQLPNARRKVRIDGHKRVCTEDDLRQAAQAFLAVSELFDPQGTGYRLIADILCGQHAMALRTADPSFHAMSAISSSNLEVESLLCSIVGAVTTIREWEGKNWSVKRNAVLDSRTEQYLPLHIQDHTRLKVKCKETKLTLPMPYTDTSALVIGASSPQINELTPYIEDASVIFLNCARTELAPTRLNISGYDPQIAAQLRGETSRIAVLLRWWWSGALEDEDTTSYRRFTIKTASYSIFGYCLDKTSDQGVRLDYYMAEERDINGWKVEDCYILEQMRDTAAIPSLTRMEQDDGTVCYFFGDTCIRVRESHEDGKIRLEPVAGDQTACGEWVELSIDRVHGYCTLLERHLNKGKRGECHAYFSS